MSNHTPSLVPSLHCAWLARPRVMWSINSAVLIRAGPLSGAVAYRETQSAEMNAEEEEERDERAGLSAAEGCVGSPEVWLKEVSPAAYLPGWFCSLCRGAERRPLCAYHFFSIIDSLSLSLQRRWQFPRSLVGKNELECKIKSLFLSGGFICEQRGLYRLGVA